MEKTASSIRVKFPPTTMYWNHIVEISQVLYDENNNVEVKFSYEKHDYLLSNIEEINSFEINSNNSINALEIKSFSESLYVSLSLSSFDSTLYISEGNTFALGVCERIKAIVFSQKKPFGKLFANPYIQGPIAMILAFVPINKLSWNYALIIFLLLVWWYCSYNLRINLYNKIYLSNKIESIPFYVKKKDEIILALLSGAIGYFLNHILS